MMNTRTNNLLLFLLTAFLLSGCGVFENEQKSPQWEDLQFPVEFAYKLFLSDGDLYVAAGYDGLYYLEGADPENGWQYLGHKITEGERYRNVGVQVVDVYNDIILIGIRAPALLSIQEWVGIWRSEDGGQSWAPSDEGLRMEEFNYSSVPYLLRSPHEPERVVASSVGEIYYSEDGGLSWTAESSDSFKSGGSLLEIGFKWHPEDPKVVWTYGESGFFQPFLAKTENTGAFWEWYGNIQVPIDNAFFDLAFDAFDPEVIYVGAQGAVIKSEAGGQEWTNRGEVTVAFTDPKGNFFYALEAHPQKGGVLYASAGPNLYRSRSGGTYVTAIETPERLNFIYDLWFDEHRKLLYVAGEFGVFSVSHID